MKIIHALLLEILFWDFTTGQTVTQSTNDVLSKEGESVTFNCTYSGGYPSLMWYLQEPSKSITFIQHDQSTIDDLMPRFRDRFLATFLRQERLFSLTISPVTAEDSGVYYCVLSCVRETVALTFGKGTKLTIQPDVKNTKAPSVFMMMPKDEFPSTACLVMDYYPSGIEFANSTNQEKEIPSVLTKKGLYSTVLVEATESSNFQCKVKHLEKWVTNVDLKDDYNQFGSEQASEVTECEGTSDTSAQSIERVNVVSITVLVMRVLFTKTVVFNLILSLKVFFM